MSDLTNPWPSWGETGELPPDGFFYEGGDQVNEKHLDALWNTTRTEKGNLIDGITERVADIANDIILDNGLSASTGTNAREVDVTASNKGAYVSGQQTGSTSATTLTLSTNGSGTTRTDSVWVNQNGTVGTTEGTTSVAADRFKIAEGDVEPNDTISEIRNVGRRLTQQYRAEDQPDNPLTGDIWHDATENRSKVRQNGAYRKLLTDQDSVDLTAGDGLDGGGSISLDGGSTSVSVDVSDFAGTHLADDGSNNLQVNDDFVENGGDTMSGALNMGDNPLGNASTLTANSYIENARYTDTGSLPTAPEGAVAFVQSEDTLYVQID